MALANDTLGTQAPVILHGVESHILPAFEAALCLQRHTTVLPELLHRHHLALVGAAVNLTLDLSCIDHFHHGFRDHIKPEGVAHGALGLWSIPLQPLVASSAEDSDAASSTNHGVDSQHHTDSALKSRRNISVGIYCSRYYVVSLSLSVG